MKVAVTRCFLPNWLRIHLPTGTRSTHQLIYKFAKCNSSMRRTSLVGPSKGHGANVQPWMPLALWNQFVATDYLCQRLLSDITLNRFSKCNHQMCGTSVQEMIQLKSRLRIAASPFRRHVMRNYQTPLHQVLE